MVSWIISFSIRILAFVLAVNSLVDNDFWLGVFFSAVFILYMKWDE